MDTKKLLQDRERTHGSYEKNCEITMDIWRAMQRGASFEGMADHQKVTLFMWAMKIHRIVNGDANVHDHWDDVAGYAQLTAALLPGTRPPTTLEGWLATLGIRVVHVTNTGPGEPTMRVWVGDQEYLPPCVEREGPAVAEPRTEAVLIDGMGVGKYWLTRSGQMAHLDGITRGRQTFCHFSYEKNGAMRCFSVMENGRISEDREYPLDIVAPATRDAPVRPAPVVHVQQRDPGDETRSDDVYTAAALAMGVDRPTAKTRLLVAGYGGGVVRDRTDDWEARQDAARQRPGTPEDGGHHARQPEERLVPRRVVED